MPYLSYHGCPVLEDPSWISWPVLTFLSWLSCLICFVLAVLSQPSYPDCPIPAILSRLSCPGCPVLAVLARPSYPGCISWLSYPSPVPAVPFRLFCPGCHVLAVPSSYHVRLSYTGCTSCCPVLSWLYKLSVRYYFKNQRILILKKLMVSTVNALKVPEVNAFKFSRSDWTRKITL
jgi:hypothetical protein